MTLIDIQIFCNIIKLTWNTKLYALKGSELHYLLKLMFNEDHGIKLHIYSFSLFGWPSAPSQHEARIKKELVLFFTRNLKNMKQIYTIINNSTTLWLHVITYRKLRLKWTWRLTKANSRNEMLHWTIDKIGVAIETWLWVRVELMVW